MKKIVIIFLLLAFPLSIFSQRGKDGAVTISSTSTVNAYTALTANAAAGTTTLLVAGTSAFSAGDLIYIIQMQGATVNCFSNIWGNPNSPEPYNSTFGEITAYNNAGNHEFAQVSSVSANTITIDCALKNNYTASGKVQVLRVPRYSSLIVNSTITCPQWNGTTGGVIAIEVLGNTTINAGGAIDASGRGFRGGITTGKTTGLMGGGSWGHNNPSEGGYKGESIAGDVLTYSVNFQGLYCKGAVANGGGGGNANNCGGGGGANGGSPLLYTGTGNPDASTANFITAWNLESAGFASSSSSGGGRGGYAFSDASISPLTNGPNLLAWNGDSRRNQGGLGGRPLDYSSGQVFAGGGGGAGDENDGYGGAGGNGGGIINIVSYGNLSGGGQVRANGANGVTTSTPNTLGTLTGRDGAGGGGGGGAIIINCTGTMNTLTLSASGGNGGNAALRNNSGSTNNSYGPGGGGGGGYIATTPAAITTSVNGGVNGIVTITGLNNSQIDNLFPPNGATSGGAGTVNGGLTPVVTVTTTSQGTICANNSGTVAAGSTGTAAIGWYTLNAGGTLLGTGSVFTTSVFVTPGTYTLYAGYCPGGTYRVPAVITVTNSPTVTVNSASICSGQTATLSASGASSYLWSTGSTSSSITPSPTATTVYTVTGSNGSCFAAAAATVNVDPAGSLTVNSSTLCAGQTATLTAAGAGSYTWSTGTNASSIIVTPSATAIYTVNASSGACFLSNTATVSVNSNPTVSVNSSTICAGQNSTLTATGAASYVWNTTATTSSISVSPSSTQVYTVTGSTNNCSDVRTATVTVNPNPTVTVNSATICSGATGTLSASGAISYSWSTNATTASITAQPAATTVYTVTGYSGACQNQKTATLTVINTPTVSVNSATICSGTSTVLNASGATNYSWSTGSTAGNISVSPTSQQIYTVTGFNGNCSSSMTATVSVNNVPSLSLNGTVFNLCSGESATITALSSENTYTWNTGDNTASIITSTAGSYTVSTFNNCGTTSSVVAVNLSSGPPSFSVIASSSVMCTGQTITLTTSGSSGTFTWSTGAVSNSIVVSSPTLYTATLANGCGTVTASADIGGNAPPAVSISASSSTLCSGGSVTLTANSSGDLLWSHNSQTTSVTTVTTTGIYSVTATNECGSSLASYTIVNGAPPLILITPVGALCAGQTATLSASGATSYSWNTGDSGSQITINAGGTYTAAGTNSCGTSNTAYTASFLPLPQVSLTASDYTICPLQTTTLVANGLNGGPDYSWNNFPGNISNTQTVSSSGVFSVTYTNTCGSSSTSVTITQSTVQADFNLSPASGTSPLNVSFNNTSTNNAANQWNFGNGQSSGNVSENNITYTSPGIYTVTLIVQNTDGCTSVYSRTLEVIPTGFGPIPEVITPNNDNYNDAFYINGIERYPNNELQIFNRWGNLVYEMKNYNNSWKGNSNVNGKTEGDKLPAGTYFILLQLNDGSGTVYKSYCQLMY